MQLDAVSLAISAGTTTPLIKSTLICIIYAVILGLLIFVTQKTTAVFMKKVMLHVRDDVYSSIMNISLSDYHSKNSGDYITLLNQNISTFEENYCKNIFSIWESIVGITAGVILLMLINPVIAVISIISMTIPSLLPKLFGTRLGTEQSTILKNTASYTSKIKDAFNGYEIIKTYHIEPRSKDTHHESATQLENSKQQLSSTTAVLYGLTNAASITTQFVIMLVAGIGAVNGLISLGNIIAVTQLTGQVISPAFGLSTKFAQLKSVKPVCEQLIAFTKHTQVDEKPTKKVKNILTCDNVSFSYGDTPIIKNFTFTFDAGKKYAITGKSGSGKSTLLKLLAGYYNNYDGTILVDNTSNMQCEYAFIQQNVFLFDDTVRINITLGDSYSNTELQQAVDLAGLTDVIDKLPDGLDTQVEENGNRFSGGERQRIAIARALLHRKNILLIDEATSALDKENADKIDDTLLNLDGVTCINVTHRLDKTATDKYDYVLNIENGRLC